ncbi:hypothetical protein PTT03_10695 [Serratia ureilytica]|uniref:hypothetical protein n=1 Tax=Serratia ureilytica TaxID=300181 RepID=UPI00313B0814
MTDKTPKNTAETAVNTSAALAKTTDTAREGELKSRALPQADALKARFKAGSIPLQTDFADLIDLANMGRQAMGNAKGPANGFTLSSEGRLELKPNTDKGISVDRDGVAVKVDESNGVQVNHSGISVKLFPDQGLEFAESGIQVKVNRFKGVDVDREGVAVKVNSGKGLKVDRFGVGVKLNSNWGLEHDKGGVRVKVNKTKGMDVNHDGIAIKPGRGIEVNNDGVSIQLSLNENLIVNDNNELSLNLPIGFGFLSLPDFNPHGIMEGIWSSDWEFNPISSGFIFWIRVK